MALKRGTRRSTLRNTGNRRRKGKLAVILPWLRRFGVVLGAGVFALWLGTWLWMSGSIGHAAHWSEQKIIEASADMGFRVSNILVEGRNYTDPDALRAIINSQKGDPLFAFNPDEAQVLIEQINWVKRVHVERRLPGTIYIGLEERQPLALWQENQKLALIDDQGRVITSERLSRFKDLMIVTGKGGKENAPELIADLKAEDVLYGRTEAAQRIGERRWDLKLKPGITVKLPEGDVGLALRRLALAQDEDGLLDKDITSADLRDPTRITVQTRPGAVQEYKAGYKTGGNI